MTCYLNLEDQLLGCSVHAYKRREQRGIQRKKIAHLLRFGRKTYQNGSIYYSIGRKEIRKYQHICQDLKQMNGLHLVMSPNGIIITIFKNKNFRIIKHC